MSIVDIAPIVRGAFLARHGVPVVVTTGGLPVSENGPRFAVGSAAELAGALASQELALPSSLAVEIDGETTVFTARALGELTAQPDARSAEARSAVRRSDVVAGMVAVVTGGAQGFGAEIVRGLVDSGAYVYIADLNTDGAEKLAAELGERTSAITVNVSDEASVAAMAETIARTTGGVDLVVSNAGVVRAGSVLEQELKDFAFTTDINYSAFFLVTKHLGRLLAAQHSVSPSWMTDIIQINSKSGLVGSNKNGAYAGSKFGGIGLVQSFALELVEHGVKVNAICPGNFYDGPLWSDPDRGLFRQYLDSGKVPGATTVDEVREFYEAKVPLRRGTYGADVMRAVYYIVEQEYETGQAIPVTGGQVMLSS